MEHPLWASFHSFLIICQYSIEKSPPRSYIHLLIGLFVFWYLAPWAVWIFWRLILCHLHHFRILSPILWVFFCLVYDYLCCAEAKFNWIPLAYFCFYFHYSKVSEKTYCCDLCQRVLCLCFPLRVLWGLFLYFSSVQFCSVAQSCLTLCDPMNPSTPGLPVHPQLPEFTQTHVHRVHDAIQPSHPLSSPSPPAPNPSQHQSLIQWINSSHEVAKVLEFQLQHHSFQRNPRADLL